MSKLQKAIALFAFLAFLGMFAAFVASEIDQINADKADQREHEAVLVERLTRLEEQLAEQKKCPATTSPPISPIFDFSREGQFSLNGGKLELNLLPIVPPEIIKKELEHAKGYKEAKQKLLAPKPLEQSNLGTPPAGSLSNHRGITNSGQSRLTDQSSITLQVRSNTELKRQAASYHESRPICHAKFYLASQLKNDIKMDVDT